MIIVKIDAGLGNQMLEYCFYRELTDELKGCSVKADMDRWIYEKYAPHNGFELNKVFGIEFDKVATTKEILSCGGEYQRRRPTPWDVIKKKYYNDLRRLPADGRIVRMHQEEWYPFLKEHRGSIEEYDCWIDNAWCRTYEPAFNDFVYRNELTGRNREISDHMRDQESVAVHIRLDGAFNSLKDEYFNNAIRFMKERLDKPVFYFFSNAPERVRDKYRELQIDGEVIDWNRGEDSHFDMQLMSACRHNIICFSSFSLWGAILNDNPDKTVIKPDLLPDILVPKKGSWYSADNEGMNLRKLT